MNLFQALWDFVNPRENIRAKPIMGGEGAFLSEDALFRLSKLREQEGWEDFVRCLDREVNIQGEVMLQSRDSAALNEARGQVLGLRKAALLVDELLNYARTVRADAERRSEPGFDGESAALFGSPAWRGR